MNTQQIVLASRPAGMVTPENFRLENHELLVIQQGQVLLKGMYFSVDPYMRGRMNDAKSYISPFKVGQAIEGGVIATVVESKSKNFETGDIVFGMLPWRKEIVANEKSLQKIDPAIKPVSFYLGILGLPGLTAYFGLMKVGKPSARETVMVSGAAGAVGLVAGQLARIHGCHVVGIAGSDEKIRLLREDFGFDETINYKATTNLQQMIADACPNGIDVYFDNVGGDISDAVHTRINPHARIVVCGQISLANRIEPAKGPRVQPILLQKSATMQGFMATDFQDQFPEAMNQLSQWIKEGRLKFTETIVHGFDHLPDALVGLFKGENTGKMIVEV